MQLKLHEPLRQTAVLFAGVGHVTQLAPHCVELESETQTPPQSWYPVLHR